MERLTDMHCVACRRDAPRVTEEEIDQLRPHIPDWDMIVIDEIPRLRRVFAVANFAEALELTDSVGSLAEQEAHHPSILTEWGRVTVTWWTHKIRGLHRNDFIMAAKTDQLASA